MSRVLTQLFQEELGKPEQDQLLHLITVEVPGEDSLYLVDNNYDVSFGGQVYVAFPMRFNGIEQSSDGSINKAAIQVANPERTLQYYVENYSGLRNCRVTVKTVYSKFLDPPVIGTFTRGSLATQLNGTLAGEGTTNLLTYSDFNTISWTANAGTLSVPSLLDPEGGNTARLFTSSGADAYLMQRVTGLTPGALYTFSVWVAGNVYSRVQMINDAYAGIGGSLLVTFTPTLTRYAVTVAAPADGVVRALIGGAGTLASGTSITVWGPQLEMKPYATALVKTGAAPATRANNLQVPRYEDISRSVATFTRAGDAFKQDGVTKVLKGIPRYETGKFGQAVMVEEGTTNLVPTPDTLSGWAWVSYGTGTTDLGSTLTGGVARNYFQRTTAVGSDHRIYAAASGSTYPITVDKSKNYVVSFDILIVQAVSAMNLYAKGPAVDNMSNSEKSVLGIAQTTNVVSGANGCTVLSQTLLADNYIRVVVSIPSSFWTGTGTTLNLGVYEGWVEIGTYEYSLRYLQLEQNTYATSFTVGTRPLELLALPSESVAPAQGTFSAWVYVDAHIKRQSGLGQRIFFVENGATAGNTAILLGHRATETSWILQVVSDTSVSTLGTSSSLNTSTGWHHFTATWTASSAVAYLDGLPIITLTGHTLSTSTKDVLVGSGYAGVAYGNTLYSDVRVLKRALTAAEVLASYNSYSASRPALTDRNLTEFRFDGSMLQHNPFGKAIYSEETTTNLCLRSQEIDNAYWGKANLLAFGSGSVADSIAAPDGTLTADKIVENITASVQHYLAAGAFTVSDNTIATVSIYCKAAGRTKILLQGKTKSAAYPSVTFDLTNGATSGVTSGIAAYSCVNTGGGWFRCSVSFDVLTGASSPTFYVITHNGTTSTYTGDGTSGVYVWGAQFEIKSYATSYMATTSAAVPRGNESLTIPTAGILTPTEGSIACWAYVTSTWKQVVAGRYPALFNCYRNIDSGIGLELFHRPDANTWHLRSRDDANADTGITIADSITPDGWQHFAFTWSPSLMCLYINGVLQGSVASPKQCSAFKPTAALGTGCNSLIDALRIYTRALSNLEIASLYNSEDPAVVTDWQGNTVFNFDSNLYGEQRLGRTVSSLVPDASAYISDEFIIDSYQATESAIQFQLDPVVDFNVRVPRRRFSEICCWRYKSAECGYSGGLASCRKDIADCKAHNNSLRFGGAPGVPRNSRRLWL